MPASRYDIYAEKGTTFKLHLLYKFAGGTGIDLSGFKGAIQVRRSINDDKAILFLTENGITGGGTTRRTLPGFDMSRIFLKEKSAFGNVNTGGAWLSSARVVRCWVKSRNERNPCF